ncbi:MAG: hypothetical protein Q9221_007017 [Calogaya cf. arnoldii]
MTKRGRAESSPPPKSRTRKKAKKRVAFSAPNAAARATIKRNATTSPLLRLPPEFRDKIWTEVLGERVIHLEYKYFCDDDMDFDEFDEDYQSCFGRSPWRHIVCEDDGPEDRPKQIMVANPKYFYTLPGSRPLWRYPHAQCDLDYDDSGSSKPVEYHDHEGMRLTVLRASHQIYTEANRVLWATNTFSFPECLTFKRFMMKRKISQKRLIGGLRFEMEWDCGLINEWNRNLSMTLVKSLIGLRTLRLNILYDMKQRLWKTTEDYFLQHTSWTDGLRRLSTLPLTFAEVAFRVREWREEDGDTSYWQKDDRAKCAKDLRKILLNPQGAEVYAENQRQCQISREMRKRMEEYCRSQRTPFPPHRAQSEDSLDQSDESSGDSP